MSGDINIGQNTGSLPLLLSSIVLRCGRKNSLLLVSVPFSASWMLTVFATNVEMMFCTAFTAGLCSAIVIVVSQVTKTDLFPRPT